MEQNTKIQSRTVLGWNQDDVKQFNDLLTKANTDQLKAMVLGSMNEFSKRGITFKTLDELITIDRDQVRGKD